MSIVLQEIIEWADKSLKYWEQAALDYLISGTSLTSKDHELLLQYFLEDNKLVNETSKRPELGFKQNLFSPFQDITSRPKLRSLYNLEGVNALAKGQRIEFSDQLTVIYGLNGSGKSGYARVLGCAGFTRGDRDILKDVLNQSDSETSTSAIIEIEDVNGVQVLPFSGNSLPETSKFYMFDSTSVDVHLTKQTELTFSPSGLDYLKQLVELTDLLRGLLRDLIERNRRPNQFALLFQPETQVGQIVRVLHDRTDIDKLKKMAELSPLEEASIIDLDRDIARLKSQDIGEEIKNIEKSIEDINDLITHFVKVINDLGDEVVNRAKQLLLERLNIQKIIKAVGLEQFQIYGLTQIGTSIWSSFIHSAHEFALAESNSYPQTNEPCLFCGQPLPQSSVSLIRSLWEFLEVGSQSKLLEVEQKLKGIEDFVNAVNVDFMNEDTVYYRFLAETYPEIFRNIQSHLDYLRVRKSHILKFFEQDGPEITFVEPVQSVIPSLEFIVGDLQARKAIFQDQDVSNQIKQLEDRLFELHDRVVLKQNIISIEQYVESLRWVDKASKIVGNSSKITLKHNELFGRYVTDEFISRFEDTLNRLGRPLKVRVGTVARKGQTYKQIVLQTIDNQLANEAKADRVLSEGEKRAVAFADFLTEVALDQHSCGIILDDPVTSLDFEWRETIAKLLVEESSTRQVIIFTHDLPFLHQLKTHAELIDASTAWHQVKRGSDDVPGYVYLKSSPALEKDYKGTLIAQNKCKSAKDSEDRPEEQISLLRQGFDALRASYEYLIMYELFGQVVVRFADRISVDRLSQVVVTKEIATEIMSRYGLVSRYIGGHLHGDMTPVEPPSVIKLEDEIRAHDALREKIKSLKKGN